MTLWMQWYNCVKVLRPACSRSATFMWLVLSLVGMSIRTESLGVTSFLRAVGLKESCYPRFLHFFHTPALKLESLTGCWVASPVYGENKLVISYYCIEQFKEAVIK